MLHLIIENAPPVGCARAWGVVTKRVACYDIALYSGKYQQKEVGMIVVAKPMGAVSYQGETIPVNHKSV